MSGIDDLVDSALMDARIDLMIARAMPEGGLFSKNLFVRDAEDRISRLQRIAEAEKPIVLRVKGRA